MYQALDELINREWKTRLTAQVEKVAGGGERSVIRFRGFRGKYRLTWKSTDGKEMTKVVYLK